MDPGEFGIALRQFAQQREFIALFEALFFLGVIVAAFAIALVREPRFEAAAAAWRFIAQDLIGLALFAFHRHVWF